MNDSRPSFSSTRWTRCCRRAARRSMRRQGASRPSFSCALTACRCDGLAPARQHLRAGVRARSADAAAAAAAPQGASAATSRVIVIGATNRPDDLDDAVRRRLSRRIYVPLPDADTRAALLAALLAGQHTALTAQDVAAVVAATAGYSGSDMSALCKEAAMRPVRELSAETLATVDAASLRPIAVSDFHKAIMVSRPSVSPSTLSTFEEWNRAFGSDVDCF